MNNKEWSFFVKENFVVNFFVNKDGLNSRMTLQGTRSIHLSNATSDFAVQAYLQRTYPNSTITINDIQWR